MELKHVAIANLSVSAANMRCKGKTPDLTNILPSVRARGVLVPLIVRMNGSPDTYEIVAGKRRYHAALAVAEETLDAITRNQATFTTRDLAMFVHRHSDGKDQYDQVLAAVKAGPDLVQLGKDGRGELRFTSRDMIETKQRLGRATDTMANRDRHGVPDRDRDIALARAAARGMILSSEQRSALELVTAAKDLGVVIGYAGTGKSAMLGVAREAWEGAGYSVHGIAPSGIAAENLESGSGIVSRTIASIINGIRAGSCSTATRCW